MSKAIILALSLFLTSQWVRSQSIDAQSSVVKFSLDNMKWNTVEGSLKGMQGKIDFNPASLVGSSMNVCVDVNSINTENEKRDEHLKTADFFDSEKYPTICFVSESISKTNQGYLAKGKLTIKDVTKEVQIPFTHANGEFKGSLEIKRLDYKVGEDTGTFMVGDEVSIEINCKMK